MNEQMEWKVPRDLPLAEVIEIRDGLKSGEIRLTFAEHVRITPEIKNWQRICTEQLIAAYEDRVQQLLS
jgi:hypothetical protein